VAAATGLPVPGDTAVARSVSSIPIIGVSRLALLRLAQREGKPCTGLIFSLAVESFQFHGDIRCHSNSFRRCNTVPELFPVGRDEHSHAGKGFRYGGVGCSDRFALFAAEVRR
jgi:hypothetical protein